MKKIKLLLALCQKRLCITYGIDFMRKNVKINLTINLKLSEGIYERFI